MALIEQEIIDAVIDRLGNIRTTNTYTDVNGSPQGYRTDIGETVADSRPNWDENELPATSVFQGTVLSEENDDEGISVERTMPLMIKVFLKRMSDPAEDAAFARKCIADICSAIRTDDQWEISGTPRATLTREKNHGIEYAENTFEITGVQIEIEIIYRSFKFDLENEP